MNTWNLNPKACRRRLRINQTIKIEWGSDLYFTQFELTLWDNENSNPSRLVNYKMCLQHVWTWDSNPNLRKDKNQMWIGFEFELLDNWNSNPRLILRGYGWFI